VAEIAVYQKKELGRWAPVFDVYCNAITRGACQHMNLVVRSILLSLAIYAGDLAAQHSIVL
jgi:hypothetical protein